MAGAMGRQRCKHETNAAKLVGDYYRGRLVGSLGMDADPNTSLVGLVRWPTSTSLSYEQAGSRSEDFAPRHGPAAGGMPQTARLHEIAEVPDRSPAPVAASAPWAFAILVVGTSPDSKAPHRRSHQDAGELHVALVCRLPALQLGKRCAFVGSKGAPLGWSILCSVDRPRARRYHKSLVTCTSA